MTDHKNAEKLYQEYKTRTRRKTVVNACTARPKWNGCDFCDVYKYDVNGECWKQNGKHSCVHVMEEKINE